MRKLKVVNDIWLGKGRRELGLMPRTAKPDCRCYAGPAVIIKYHTGLEKNLLTYT